MLDRAKFGQADPEIGIGSGSVTGSRTGLHNDNPGRITSSDSDCGQGGSHTDFESRFFG